MCTVFGQANIFSYHDYIMLKILLFSLLFPINTVFPGSVHAISYSANPLSSLNLLKFILRTIQDKGCDSVLKASGKIIAVGILHCL